MADMPVESFFRVNKIVFSWNYIGKGFWRKGHDIWGDWGI